PSPKEVFWSHYIDESNEPLYEFGYGLSYTSFKYENLKLNTHTFNESSEIIASVSLTNTGKVAGKEVVQFYIRDLFASITRPVKELKGFEMVSLEPGETKEVSFVINKKTIEFYSANNIWESEIGDFKLFVGGSSKTVLEKDFSYSK
ncbi:fibronectin type III-like domain-contianing protein, partial [Bacteroidota bacterium]